MRRPGILIAATALVTAVLTSIFWIALYNSAAPARPEPGTTATAITRISEPGGEGDLILAPSGLAVPVAGVKLEDLIDTYAQSRGSGRAHNAIDIMAPRGTPVLAAAAGTIEKLFFSQGGGGITVYVRSPDRQWIHYYAHLDAYAPGLAEGQQVERGQPIGTVGSSGNADPDGPHLHFAVHRMMPGEKWHQGMPVNPYPLLRGPR